MTGLVVLDLVCPSGRPTAANRLIVNHISGEERRDERDRGRAPSGHGPVMGRQVAQPVPEGGHCRPADPHPLRPPTEDLRRDPEGR